MQVKAEKRLLSPDCITSCHTTAHHSTAHHITSHHITSSAVATVSAHAKEVAVNYKDHMLSAVLVATSKHQTLVSASLLACH